MIFKFFIGVGTLFSMYGAVMALCILLVPSVHNFMVEMDMKKDILQGAWRTVEDFRPYFVVFEKMPRIATVSHFVAAFLWMVGSSFQLTPYIRHNHKTFHHWCGYFTLLSGLTIIASGSVMIISKMYTSTPAESFLNLRSAFIFFGLLFSFCLVNAVLNARAKRFVQHKKFVIRTIFLGFTGMYARIIAMTVFTADNMKYILGIPALPKYGSADGAVLERLAYGWSEWLSVVCMLVLAELYIKIKVHNEIEASLPATILPL
jgi:hypothetical protein